jgi:hypothetical protein
MFSVATCQYCGPRLGLDLIWIKSRLRKKSPGDLRQG